MYDHKLSELVLSMAAYAPLFFLGFGYWMASSLQLVSNEWLTPITTSGSTSITHHTLFDLFTARGWYAPAWPLLLMFIIYLAVILVVDLVGTEGLSGVSSKLKMSWLVSSAQSDEKESDSYFNTLEQYDLDWSIAEEENSRDLVDGMSILTDWQHEKLLEVEANDNKNIIGTHTYNILANERYKALFQYVDCMADRALLIKDGDDDEENDEAQSNLTKVLLFAGYPEYKKVQKMKFEKDAFLTFNKSWRPKPMQECQQAKDENINFELACKKAI